jgi:hypothetical protein
LAGLRSRATSFDDVIDRVQPKHSRDNQIDRDRETHDARRDHEKYPRRERGDRQKGVCSIEVHPEFIPDSDAGPAAGR